MFIRFFAVCLATIFAAMPLAARAGDFRLNALGSKTLPSVYAWSGCRSLGVDGNRRLSYAACTRDGGIQIRQHYSNPQSSTCELRVWETGLLKFTWHAEFKKNEHTVCSIKWANDDTLDLHIIND
jgi:hypothetical protein